MGGPDADRLVDLLERLVLACEQVAARLAEGRPADAPGGRKGRRTPGAAAPAAGAEAGSPSGCLDLPPEVGTAEAAELLGVSKDTVLEYRRKGLLPFRDLAPPGSTKPIYMFPLEAVVKMRTAYRTEEEAPDVPREPARRGVKGRRQFKHLIIREEP